MKRSRITFCNGPSMKPTVMPGDVIEIEEVGFDELRPGNIIVYNCPDNIRLNIIHRVIGRDCNGLITRGDNNSSPDPYRVRVEHRPSRVVAVTRGTRCIPIRGWGMFENLRRILQRQWRILSIRFLHPICVCIADSGFFFTIGAFLKTEVRGFKRPEGIERQLFSRGKRIGILPPNMVKWRIRLPWRFFVRPPTEYK